MPWKETRVQDQRTQFVAAWLTDDTNFAELCREFGISRKTGYKWRERYEAAGPPGLGERTSAPHRRANATPLALEDAILELRREHNAWGPRLLRSRLLLLDEAKPVEERTAWPSVRTFAAILGRHGLSGTRRKRKPKLARHSELAPADEANDVWAMDFKGWFRCGDGTRCDPFTLLDLHSRFLLRCVALTKTDGASVQGVLAAAFRQYGLPRVLRSDNGAPFASSSLAGLSTLSLWLIRLGVRPEYIEPGKPQQNGCLERFHRTLKAECCQPPASTWRAQQRRFEQWRHVYNEERPHQALGDRPPASVFCRSRRYLPTKPKPFRYPSHLQRCWVYGDGHINWHRGSVLLGAPFANQWVALVPLHDPDERYTRLFYERMPLAVYDEWMYKFLPIAAAKSVLAEWSQQEDWHW